jgi:hypothetical protein
MDALITTEQVLKDPTVELFDWPLTRQKCPSILPSVAISLLCIVSTFVWESGNVKPRFVRPKAHINRKQVNVESNEVSPYDMAAEAAWQVAEYSVDVCLSYVASLRPSTLESAIRKYCGGDHWPS